MGTLRRSLFILVSLVGASAHAQHGGSLTSGGIGGDVGAVYNVNDARNQILRENSAQMQQLQAQKLQAQNAANQCAVNYQKAIADINAQQAQQQAQQAQNNAQQAAQGMGDTINDVANNLQNGGLRERGRGKAEMAAAETQAKQMQAMIAESKIEGAAEIAQKAFTYSKSGMNINTAMLVRLCTDDEFRKLYTGTDISASDMNGYGYMNPVSQCQQMIRAEANQYQSRWNNGRIARDGGQSVAGMIGGALLNGLGTLAGQKLAQKPQQQLRDAINNGQKESADLDKQNCEEQARQMVANVDRQIDEAQKSGARALADAEQAGKLANMINRNATLGTGAGGTVDVSGGELPQKAPRALAAAAAGGGGNAGGGGGAAVAGGGGGGGASEIPYTFPNNQPYGSGPTGPLTPADYEVAGNGGGGMFGGGDMGFADAGPQATFDNGAGFAPDAGTAGDAIGDGGLFVLMARMRTQLANNADVLVKQMKLENVATRQPTSTTAVAPRNQ